MRTKEVISAIVAMMLGVSLAGAGFAQTTSTTVTVSERKFEILAVDGNNLVVLDERGAYRLSVPEDFRFTIDGQKMSAKELKPGMKGTALVTKTTKISPVILTDIREGTVVDATTQSVIVRTKDGTKRFTQAQLDDRGVQMLKDGKVIRIGGLNKGDVVTATFISQEPPVVMTETEVKAKLAK